MHFIKIILAIRIYYLNMAYCSKVNQSLIIT
jgi:hypothetical protein